MQAAKLEAAQQAQQRHVPLASIEIIGSGVMTWSRERDRCINVSDGELSMSARRWPRPYRKCTSPRVPPASHLRHTGAMMRGHA